jgi:tetratricopeptide (TPR) repeat protein
MGDSRALRRRAARWVIWGLAGAIWVLVARPVRSASQGKPLDGIRQALEQAEEGLALGELQIAESRYRTAIYEAWLVLASLERQAGNLEAAQAAGEHALEATFDNRRGRIALALIDAKLGEVDEAELLLRSLIADDSADQESRRLLARVLADGGRVEAAIQELKQLHYLTPGDAENAYFLATAYLREESLEEADALLDELAAAIPTAQTWILIGRTYRDAEHFSRARAALRKALEVDPKVERAHYYLGTTDLLDQGQALLDSATVQFEAELEIQPRDPMTNLFLGMALVELRRYEEAIPRLEIAAGLAAVRADAERFLGRSLLSVGRTDEAIAALRRGLEAAGGDIEGATALPEFEARQISSLHYQLAQALRRSGATEEAESHFEAAKRFQARSAESARESLDRYLASEVGPSPLTSAAEGGGGELERATAAELEALRGTVSTALARAYLNLGVLESREEKLPAAVALFEQAAALDPDLPQLQYSLGAARFSAGQFSEAAVALQRALDAAPENIDLRRMLALAWLNSGAYPKAVELLAVDPARQELPQLQYAYGLALVRSDRASEAEEVFSQLLASHENWPELNVVLGQAYAQQGDYAAAIRTLLRALELDPRVAEAHSTLGEIHLRRGELDAAEQDFRAELAEHPGDERTVYTLATVLDLNRKSDAAATLLGPLLERHPEIAKARYLLGKILLARGEVEKAAEQLEAAAGLSPGDPMVYYQLGLAYRELDRTDESRQAFESFRALKKDPG